MTAEMGRLARRHNLLALGYLLGLSRLEAPGQTGQGLKGEPKRIA